MKCPKCHKGNIRQHVSIYVDCDVDCHDLSKKGIRKADVKIMGAGWPHARWYCPKCGWAFRLDKNYAKDIIKEEVK